MRRTLPAAALVLALAVAGCSSSTTGGGTTVTSHPPTKSPTTAPTACCTGPLSIAPSSQSSGGGSLTQQQAQDALLSATDLGSDFTQTPSDDTPSPLPCRPNDPPLDQQVPPKVKALTSFSNSAGTALLQEEIDGYKDLATTQHALSVGENGLSCSRATITSGNNTVQVKLNGPIDLADQLSVKVDKIEAWQVVGGGVQLVLIAAQVGPQIVAMTFTASKKLDPSKLPKTQAIVEKALANVQDAQ